MESEKGENSAVNDAPRAPVDQNLVDLKLKHCPEGRKMRNTGLATRLVANNRYRDAAKLMCLQCMNFDRGEVVRCSAHDCALWEKRAVIFRFRGGGDE